MALSVTPKNVLDKWTIGSSLRRCRRLAELVDRVSHDAGVVLAGRGGPSTAAGAAQIIKKKLLVQRDHFQDGSQM